MGDGQCLNRTNDLRYRTRNNILMATAPRGSELYLLGDRIAVAGQPFYAHPTHKVYDDMVYYKTFYACAAERAVIWVNDQKVLCSNPLPEDQLGDTAYQNWGRDGFKGHTSYWTFDCPDACALAVAPYTALVANATHIYALDLKGRHEKENLRWKTSLPAPPVRWGIAIDQKGRTIVSLTNGIITAFGNKE
jgi:hypothetical protein